MVRDCIDPARVAGGDEGTTIPFDYETLYERVMVLVTTHADLYNAALRERNEQRVRADNQYDQRLYVDGELDALREKVRALEEVNAGLRGTLANFLAAAKEQARSTADDVITDRQCPECGRTDGLHWKLPGDQWCHRDHSRPHAVYCSNAGCKWSGTTSGGTCPSCGGGTLHPDPIQRTAEHPSK